MRQSPWTKYAVALLVLAAVPFLGHWLRQVEAHRCTVDGMPIDPVYRVRIVDNQQQSWQFCCLRCAELWLKRQSEPPQAIHVTDEATGREIDADDAFYVRSMIVTQPATGNDIHVFDRRVDAQKHAQASNGVILPNTEKPL